jgi:hypothetical protein
MGQGVVLELARWELRPELRAAYDALVADLAALGCEVELEEAIERRGGGTSFTPPLADLVVHLRESVDEQLLEAMGASVLARVGAAANWPRRRTAIVLAPDGKVLHRLRLSEPQDRGGAH